MYYYNKDIVSYINLFILDLTPTWFQVKKGKNALLSTKSKQTRFFNKKIELKLSRCYVCQIIQYQVGMCFLLHFLLQGQSRNFSPKSNQVKVDRKVVDSLLFYQREKQTKNIFLTFPACFYIPIIFSNLNSNCSNLLYLRNLQELVKKA